jgi:hypothetical protein
MPLKTALSRTCDSPTKAPDLDLGADGQPVAGIGHAHRRLEAAEVGVEVVSLVADHHELAGLVGGDEK